MTEDPALVEGEFGGVCCVDRRWRRRKDLDQECPAVWHHVERYANNRIEADHAQLKRRLRAMRGVKTHRGLRVLAVGHAFVQNLRRGHYEIATERPTARRLEVAFATLAQAI